MNNSHALLKEDDWVSAQIARFPEHIQRGIRYHYRRIRTRKLVPADVEKGVLDGGRARAANLWLLELGKRFPAHCLPLGASDAQLVEFAKERAEEAARACPSLDALAAYCEKYRVPLPNSKEKDEAKKTAAILRRAGCDLWWRRALRRSRGRAAEKLAIELGMVKRSRQLYASHDAVNMRRAQKARNQAVLDAMVAINELGEAFSLSELVDKSVSNPALRRVELMCRMAGFESIAQSLELAGEFVTLTAPSRFHSHFAESGARNPKWSGEDPRQTADYLCSVWSRITSALDRQGIKIFGMRIAEAHHDGCPHFHCLFFLRPQDRRAFRRTVARHAVREDRDELGLTYAQNKGEAMQMARERRREGEQGKLSEIAQRIGWEAAFWASSPKARVWKAIKPRVDFKPIDWARGTATGYLIKYVAKNIDGRRQDGESAGLDFEAADDIDGGADMTSTCRRADAWASTWGIRQFQQVGGPPVTVWRELRRWEATGADNVIELAAIAADVGDWGRFVEVMGGWEKRRREMPLKTVTTAAAAPNRYGEAGTPSMQGVVEIESGFLAVTRTHVWEIKRDQKQAGGAAATWTRVNNSTKSQIGPQTAIPAPEHLAGMGRPATAEDIERWLDDNADADLLRAVQPPAEDPYLPPAELARRQKAQRQALYHYRMGREHSIGEDGEWSDQMALAMAGHFRAAEAERERTRAHVEMADAARRCHEAWMARRQKGIAEVTAELEQRAARAEREARLPQKRRPLRDGLTVQEQNKQAMDKAAEALRRARLQLTTVSRPASIAAGPLERARALLDRLNATTQP